MDAIVYDKVGKEAEKVREALYGIYPQETITDAAIASFDDGADGIPVKALTVGIEPVQDLHGYDNPWPAGGGVNKFGDYTVVNGYIQSDGVITAASGNKTYIVPIEAGTAYGLKIVRTSKTGGTADDDVQVAEYSSENRPVVGETVGTRIAAWGYVDNLFRYAFTTGANTKWLAIKIGNEQKTDVEATAATVQLEKGSSVPTTPYTPYSNICPISGWTGAEIEQTGLNVWDEEWEVSGNRVITKNYISVIPGASYYYKCDYGATFYFYDINKSNQIVVYPNANSIFTVPADKYYLIFQIGSGYGSTYNRDVSINYPATDTAYHPYAGNQISVTFPDEAGTVYGARMTLNPDRTGTLVVDRAKVDLGTLTYSKSSTIQNGFVATGGMPADFPVAPDSSSVPNWLCSQYKVYSNNGIEAAGVDGAIAWRVAGLTQGVIIRDSNYADYYTNNDMAAFKAAMSGVQLVYELITPQTFRLTAAEVSDILTTIYGTNNIWADTGDIEKLTYHADLGKYIDSHITTAVANALNA